MKAGRDLYRVKKSWICGEVLGLMATRGIGSHTKITLFAPNLIELEKKRRRRSVCLNVNLSRNKHKYLESLIFSIIENPSRVFYCS